MEFEEFEKLKNMSKKELFAEKKKLMNEYFKLNLLKKINPPKDNSVYKKLRRQIARINFLLNTK